MCLPPPPVRPHPSPPDTFSFTHCHQAHLRRCIKFSAKAENVSCVIAFVAIADSTTTSVADRHIFIHALSPGRQSPSPSSAFLQMMVDPIKEIIPHSPKSIRSLQTSSTRRRPPPSARPVVAVVAPVAAAANSTDFVSTNSYLVLIDTMNPTIHTFPIETNR